MRPVGAPVRSQSLVGLVKSGSASPVAALMNLIIEVPDEDAGSVVDAADADVVETSVGAQDGGPRGASAEVAA